MAIALGIILYFLIVFVFIPIVLLVLRVILTPTEWNEFIKIFNNKKS